MSGHYPSDWPDIAFRVKEAAGWLCIRCGHDHNVSSGHTLTVHHLDMDKSNVRWWNLVALCQRCHLSVQGRVVMERPYMFEHAGWFKPYAAGYYAATIQGRPEITRNEVEADMAALLALGRVA